MGYHLGEKTGGKKRANILSNLSIIACLMINMSVIIGATVEVSVVLSEFLGTSTFLMKLAIVSVFLLVTMFVLEPEKLKNLGKFSALAYIIISNYL